MKLASLLHLGLMALAACGGKALMDDASLGPDGTGGGDGGGSAADGATSEVGGEGGGGAGGVAGAGGAGGSVDAGEPEACVPSTAGTGGFQQPACDDLDRMRVEHPVVADDTGDGIVSPGEGVTLTVDLREIAGHDFMFYPGVLFTSNHPGVQVGGENWLYGLFACGYNELPTRAQFDGSIEAGTVVTITARVAMLGAQCPSAPALEIPIPVQ